MFFNQYLASFDAISRSYVQKLIKDGLVTRREKKQGKRKGQGK